MTKVGDKITSVVGRGSDRRAVHGTVIEVHGGVTFFWRAENGDKCFDYIADEYVEWCHGWTDGHALLVAIALGE